MQYFADSQLRPGADLWLFAATEHESLYAPARRFHIPKKQKGAKQVAPFAKISEHNQLGLLTDRF
ncbi:MAG TPA: hypothetical protein DCM48_01455 [Thalassospira sp.]|nr:hypothetical protein [Thalassospira sp.]